MADLPREMKSEVEVDAVFEWTSKQGRILTANGKATEFYVQDRGFPFQEKELPHHHLKNNTTKCFAKWALENKKPGNVCGAFFRPLFVGDFEHTTDRDEIVYNVQTNTLFIDMRIPRLGKKVLGDKIASFGDMSDEQIKLFARRHAFSGYTVSNNENGRPVCTRHHCIDWNFVGVPRPRPNKWYVEMNADSSVWKEWAYARDKYDQHYYWERWERLKRDGNGNGLVLALRKERTENDDRDGIIVAVGDHFNYIFGRKFTGKEKEYDASSLVDLVDASIAIGDRVTAESYLSIDAGHGFISKGWKIDCALQPWREGSSLLEDNVSIEGSNVESCAVTIDGCTWTVYECSVCLADVQKILQWNVNSEDLGDFESLAFRTIGKKRCAKSI